MPAGRPRPAAIRTCVACRASGAKRELVRVVRSVDGQVVIDPTGRLAGRGAYVCAGGTCLETAVAKGSLSRALRIPITDAARAAILDTGRQTMINRGGANRGEE